MVEDCEKREGGLVESDGKFLAKKGGGRKVLGRGRTFLWRGCKFSSDSVEDSPYLEKGHCKVLFCE